MRSHPDLSGWERDEEFVTLKIYDTAGREIRTLINEEQYSGLHKVVWNGRNSAGEMVSSGTYFYQLQLNNSTVTKKAVLIK